MRPIKEELIYTEDPTSIGRWVELDDDEGGRRYEPVLRFNFMVLVTYPLLMIASEGTSF